MHVLLVAAIAPQQDARFDAAAREERRDPRRQRRLPRSADREVADGDGRQGQWTLPQPAARVRARSGAHDRAVQERDGQQHAARRARGRGAAPPEPLGDALGAHDVPLTSCKLRVTASIPSRSPSLFAPMWIGAL